METQVWREEKLPGQRLGCCRLKHIFSDVGQAGLENKELKYEFGQRTNSM